MAGARALVETCVVEAARAAVDVQLTAAMVREVWDALAELEARAPSSPSSLSLSLSLLLSQGSCSDLSVQVH